MTRLERRQLAWVAAHYARKLQRRSPVVDAAVRRGKYRAEYQDALRELLRAAEMRDLEERAA